MRFLLPIGVCTRATAQWLAVSICLEKTLSDAFLLPPPPPSPPPRPSTATAARWLIPRGCSRFSDRSMMYAFYLFIRLIAAYNTINILTVSTRHHHMKKPSINCFSRNARTCNRNTPHEIYTILVIHYTY